MSDVYALKPPVEGAEPKMAMEGARMFRRSEVMGALTKLTFYARRNLREARERGIEYGIDVARVRLRTLETVKDALHCLPEFENPQAVVALPRDSGSGSQSENPERSGGVEADGPQSGTRDSAGIANPSPGDSHAS